MKVNIRYKKLSAGKTRIFLDFYPPIMIAGKETRREFLELFLYEKPKTEAEREHNRQTKLLAENIRADRQLKIQAEDYSFHKGKETQTDFVGYYDSKQESKKRPSQRIQAHFKECFGQKNIEEITKSDVEKFRVFLLHSKRINKNTASSYFNRFKGVFKLAKKEGIITTNPAESFGNIKYSQPKRNFLDLNELIRLANTPIAEGHERLKEMCLFSALTGLRLSDLRQEIKKGVVMSNGLIWSQIKHSETHGHYIDFSQTKTDKTEQMHFISPEARELLGERKADHEQCFQVRVEINSTIREWVAKAGINKYITFHCFRHTYATLLITEGIDLYTVSKMLGHTDIKTTQIYAKVIDEKKKEAANSISIKK